MYTNPDNKVHGANMGQDTGGPHVLLMNFAIWEPIQILAHPDIAIPYFAASGRCEIWF